MTGKLAMISPSTNDGADVGEASDQVSPETAIVGCGRNCQNGFLAAVQVKCAETMS